MTRMIAGSSLVLAVALIGASAGAQVPQPPKSVPEAPAMGGRPQTKSGHAVIALRANEVALSQVAHASPGARCHRIIGRPQPHALPQ